MEDPLCRKVVNDPAQHFGIGIPVNFYMESLLSGFHGFGTAWQRHISVRVTYWVSRGTFGAPKGGPRHPKCGQRGCHFERPPKCQPKCAQKELQECKNDAQGAQNCLKNITSSPFSNFCCRFGPFWDKFGALWDKFEADLGPLKLILIAIRCFLGFKGGHWR